MRTITIHRDFEYVYRGYETASAWDRRILEAGTYEVEAIDPRYGSGRVMIRVPGRRVESYYVNRLFTASSVDHKTGLSDRCITIFDTYAGDGWLHRLCDAYGWTLNQDDALALVGPR